jgi:hypothetical protein
VIPYLPWEPDKGPYSTTSTDQIQNLTPIANGWAPFQSLAEVSDAMAADCRGAVYFRESDGSFGLIAGTSTALYLYDTTDGSWDAISGASAPFSVPDGQFWQFERFGSGLYATNLDDPLQVYDVDAGGTFAAVSGSPPQAKYIRTIGDFLFLAYLKVGADEFPQRWHHSGLNDTTVWTVGTKWCDRQDVPDGDEIQGIISVPGGGRLFQRRAIRSLLFTPGSQFAFQMNVIDAARGCIAPYSIITLPRGDYAYLAEEGFYRGDANEPIGAERVNKFFFDDADNASLDIMQGVPDPFDKIVWWTYVNGSGARVMIGYDWQLDRWCRSDTAATILVNAVTAGYTLEDLDAFGTIDTLPASLDSRIWKGGTPFFGAFKSDFKLYGFSGSNAAGQAKTCAMELTPGSRSFVNGCRVVTNSDNFTVTVATSDFHGGAETSKAAASYSTRSGMVPLRADGRLHRFTTDIAAGDVWTHLHGVDVEGFVQPSGQI